MRTSYQWHRVSAVISLALTACVDSADGLGSGIGDAAVVADSGVLQDAGANDGGVDSVFNPEAQHVFEEPVVIFEPGMAPGRMHSGDIKMVWTGRRYVVFWELNLGSRIELMAQSINPERNGAFTLPQAVTPSRLAGAGSGGSYHDVVVQDGQIALVRSLGAQELYFTRLSDEGGSMGIDVFLPPMDNLMSMVPWNDGFLVLDIISQPLRAIELGSQGTLRASYDLPQAERGFVARNANNGLAILWADRNNPPQGTDFVYVSSYHRTLRLAGPVEEVYQSENAIPLALGPDRSASKIVIKDLDEGPFLLDPESGEQIRLGPPGYGDVYIAYDIGQPRLFLVRETGNFEGRFLSTGFDIRAVDYDGGELGPEQTVHSDPGTCLEDVAVASSGDRVGIAFTTGCSERRLHFVEIEARGSP